VSLKGRGKAANRIYLACLEKRKTRVMNKRICRYLNESSKAVPELLFQEQRDIRCILDEHIEMGMSIKQHASSLSI